MKQNNTVTVVSITGIVTGFTAAEHRSRRRRLSISEESQRISSWIQNAAAQLRNFRGRATRIEARRYRLVVNTLGFSF